jgi:hypothetical protein|tara:strand:- start:395 stop:733 length:339 start_codon:yes stop_codon:yes gene_type:complete
VSIIRYRLTTDLTPWFTPIEFVLAALLLLLLLSNVFTAPLRADRDGDNVVPVPPPPVVVVVSVDDVSEELSPSFAQPLKIRPAVSSMMTLKWRNLLFFILILGSGYDLLMKK